MNLQDYKRIIETYIANNDTNLLFMLLKSLNINVGDTKPKIDHLCVTLEYICFEYYDSINNINYSITLCEEVYTIKQGDTLKAYFYKSKKPCTTSSLIYGDNEEAIILTEEKFDNNHTICLYKTNNDNIIYRKYAILDKNNVHTISTIINEEDIFVYNEDIYHEIMANDDELILINKKIPYSYEFIDESLSLSNPAIILALSVNIRNKDRAFIFKAIKIGENFNITVEGDSLASLVLSELSGKIKVTDNKELTIKDIDLLCEHIIKSLPQDYTIEICDKLEKAKRILKRKKKSNLIDSLDEYFYNISSFDKTLSLFQSNIDIIKTEIDNKVEQREKRLDFK